MTARIRLIVDGALPAATNMARDEALLTALADGGADDGALPALRFYRWDPPAISLGYFQSVETYDARAGELAGFELVRRPTGGGAILHHSELTYSLAAPSDFAPLGGHFTRLYELAHRAIRSVLRSLGVPADFHGGPGRGNSQRGPFFCFARRHPYDLVVGGDKIVGSAQRRRPAAILQHGTIVLRRVAPQPCTGVNDHLPEPAAVGELVDLFADHFASELAVRLHESELTPAELRLGERFEEKYASDDWTHQR